MVGTTEKFIGTNFLYFGLIYDGPVLLFAASSVQVVSSPKYGDQPVGEASNLQRHPR